MANILESTFDQFTWPVVYLEVVSNAAWLIETDLNTHQPIVDVNSLKNMAGQQMMLKNVCQRKTGGFEKCRKKGVGGSPPYLCCIKVLAN